MRTSHWRLLYALTFAAAAPASAALDVLIRDDQAHGLADAVVFAVPIDPQPAAAPAGAVIDQIDRQFAPKVSVVQTGTSVKFPNKDDIKHQVYSFSPAKIFQLKLYHGIAADPVVFDHPGLVVLGCNIHDGMIAYLYVVDSPYFALSGTDGQAKLSTLPAGRYVIHAWHYRMQGDGVETPQPVDLSAQAASIELAIPLAAEDPHPPGLD